MGELLTLQVGTYANYVGAHFWNASENFMSHGGGGDINYNHLFSVVNTPTPTRVPRCVMVDYRHEVNAVPKEGLLFGRPADDVLSKGGPMEATSWHGAVEVHQQPVVQASEYMQLVENAEGQPQQIRDAGTMYSSEGPRQQSSHSDSSSVRSALTSVKAWTDYLRVYLHPRTLHFLPNSSVAGTYAETFTQTRGLVDDVEDSMRYFAEECDSLQGIQIVSDFANEIGGVSSALLETMRDSFGPKSILVLATAAPSVGESFERATYASNVALSMDAFRQHASLVTPLSLQSSMLHPTSSTTRLPHVLYDVNNSFHTSAILATVMDSLTLPCRKSTSPQSLTEVLATHSSVDVFAAASAALPLQLSAFLPGDTPFGTLSDLLGTSPRLVGELTTSLTPDADWSRTSAADVASVIVRGLQDSYLRPSSEELERRRRVTKLDTCTSASDMFVRYLAGRKAAKLFSTFESDCALPVAPPFPPGLLPTSLETVATVTTLYSGPQTHGIVKTLRTLMTTSRWRSDRGLLSHIGFDELAEVEERFKVLFDLGQQQQQSTEEDHDEEDIAGADDE